MIPGLALEPLTEERIWQAFSSWADHFRANLAESGVAYLLESYRVLVESVERQSCTHGPGRSTLTGEAWRSYCGISYEYSNDLSARDALQVIFDATPPEATTALRLATSGLDERLRSHYPEPGSVPPGLSWWRHGLPREIAE